MSHKKSLSNVRGTKYFFPMTMYITVNYFFFSWNFFCLFLTSATLFLTSCRRKKSYCSKSLGLSVRQGSFLPSLPKLKFGHRKWLPKEGRTPPHSTSSHWKGGEEEERRRGRGGADISFIIISRVDGREGGRDILTVQIAYTWQHLRTLCAAKDENQKNRFSL